MRQGNQFKAIVLHGMTGTGKTDIALKLSQTLNGRLICGDFTQVFKGLSILTNKDSRVLKDGYLYNYREPF